jgi:large subunit ribosomal protein L29
MKAIELKEQTIEELETKLAEIKKSLFSLKLQKSTGQLENPLKIRNLRKDIARIKTMLREKELKIRVDEKGKKESIKK